MDSKVQEAVEVLNCLHAELTRKYAHEEVLGLNVRKLRHALFTVKEALTATRKGKVMDKRKCRWLYGCGYCQINGRTECIGYENCDDYEEQE